MSNGNEESDKASTILKLRVDSLLKEYELLKAEILVQIQLYHRQTLYVLVYMSFLITVLTFAAVDTNNKPHGQNRTSAPGSGQVPVLTKLANVVLQ